MGHHGLTKAEQETAYQRVISHLKKKGIRITETRKAVLSYVIASSLHPSAERIYKDLLPLHPSLSLATVYNNLRVFVDEGFVIEIKPSTDKTTYYDFMGDDHLNVICEQCGTITDLMDIPLPSLLKETEEQTGYRVTREILSIYGICPSCQAG